MYNRAKLDECKEKLRRVYKDSTFNKCHLCSDKVKGFTATMLVATIPKDSTTENRKYFYYYFNKTSVLPKDEIADDKKDGYHPYTEKFEQLDLPLKFVIEGHAGTGKTFIASSFAKQWAEGEWKDEPFKATKFPKFEIVLLISLGQLHEPCTLAEIVKEQLFQDMEKTTPKQIYKMIKHYQRSVLLILDGYDEFKRENCPEICQIIKRKWMKDLSLIITTRPWCSHELAVDASDKFVLIHTWPETFLDKVDCGYIQDGRSSPQNMSALCAFWKVGNVIPKSEKDINEKFLGHVTKKLEIDCKENNDLKDNVLDIVSEFALEDIIKSEKRRFPKEDVLEIFPEKEDIKLSVFDCLKVQSEKDQPEKGQIVKDTFYKMNFVNHTLQESLAANRLREDFKKQKNNIKRFKKVCSTTRSILKVGRLIRLVCSPDSKDTDSEVTKALSDWLRGVHSEQIPSKPDYQKFKLLYPDITSAQILFLQLCLGVEMTTKSNNIWEDAGITVGTKGMAVIMNKDKNKIIGICQKGREKEMIDRYLETNMAGEEKNTCFHLGMLEIPKDHLPSEYYALSSLVSRCDTTIRVLDVHVRHKMRERPFTSLKEIEYYRLALDQNPNPDFFSGIMRTLKRKEKLKTLILSGFHLEKKKEECKDLKEVLEKYPTRFVLEESDIDNEFISEVLLSDNYNDKVETLELININIEGLKWDFLGKLSHLKKLKFSGCTVKNIKKEEFVSQLQQLIENDNFEKLYYSEKEKELVKGLKQEKLSMIETQDQNPA